MSRVVIGRRDAAILMLMTLVGVAAAAGCDRLGRHSDEAGVAISRAKSIDGNGLPFSSRPVEHYEAGCRCQLFQRLEGQPVLARQLLLGFDGLGDQVQGPALVSVMFAQDALGQGEACFFYSVQGTVQS